MVIKWTLVRRSAKRNLVLAQGEVECADINEGFNKAADPNSIPEDFHGAEWTGIYDSCRTSDGWTCYQDSEEIGGAFLRMIYEVQG